MRVSINIITFLSVVTLSANAASVCTTVCRPVKPTCPPGQHASGSEGCWGCCVPDATIPIPKPKPSATPAPIDVRQDGGDDRICTLQCRLVKPVCPYGEAPTGGEGCWGCCQPIKG